MKIVKAKMKDGYSEFIETFEIEQEIDSAKEIQRMVDSFNEGRPKKEKRIFLGIDNEVNKVDIYDWNAVIKDAEKFLSYARRQYNNAFGNAGVKGDYKKIMGAYSKFQRGIYGNFCKLISEHSSLCYDDMTLLKNITKEQYIKLRQDYKKSEKL